MHNDELLRRIYVYRDALEAFGTLAHDIPDIECNELYACRAYRRELKNWTECVRALHAARAALPHAGFSAHDHVARLTNAAQKAAHDEDAEDVA